MIIDRLRDLPHVKKLAPINKRAPIDQEVLTTSLVETFERLIPLVFNDTPSRARRVFFRSEWGYQELMCPDFEAAVTSKQLHAPILDAVDPVLSYLWGCIVPRRDHGQWGRPEEWFFFGSLEFILMPLCELFEETMLQGIFEGRSPAIPQFDTDALMSLARHVVSIVSGDPYVEGTYALGAGVEAPWIDLGAGVEAPWIDLGDGVVFETWDGRKQALFRTLHADELGPVDFPWFPILELATVVRITAPYQYEKNRGTFVTDVIERKMTLVRITLAALRPSLSQAQEGTVLMLGPLPGRLFTDIEIQRMGKANLPSECTVHATDISDLKDIFRTLNKGNNRFLRPAIHRFRRACRNDQGTVSDRFLDAVIGLESLLVHRPGESRYRFSLHGTALLCEKHEDANALYKRLRELYDKRSKPAHGEEDLTLGHQDLADCLHLLARAIYKVACLLFPDEDNAFKKKAESESVASAVQDMVVARVTGSRACSETTKTLNTRSDTTAGVAGDS